jgi:hypothetical protein
MSLLTRYSGDSYSHSTTLIKVIGDSYFFEYSTLNQ